MDDNETFDVFYAKLSDIANSSFNLGEKIPESKIVRKILRSLPERFQPKVTAIEEVQNIDNLSVEQLVGNLQAYEANLRQPKKSKSLAFSSSKVNVEESNDDIDPEVMALFVKKFKKFLKNKKPNLKDNCNAPNFGNHFGDNERITLTIKE